MLFNSASFLVFYVLVFLLYVKIRNYRRQNVMLLVASYVFYGAWDWRFLPLMLLCTVVNYYSAQRIAASSRPLARRWLLALCLVVSFVVLGFFKYYNFGAESLQTLLGLFGLHAHLATLQIILPVGISFYTFHTVSYTVDVYRGVTRPADSFVDFALYVAYFPQLVAGPIQQSTVLLPVLQKPRRVTAEDFQIGALWIILGYAKKVVFADTLAPLVNAVFENPSNMSGATCFVSVVAFAVQIYGDFAGYTLIARGVSQLLGIPLIENFHMPYLAIDPRDFWRRWHISLSLWLRNYLYLPLGGNRRGKTRTCLNLMVTMLLGGLWHGASWTFVLWGGYYGVLLCVCQVLGLSGKSDHPGPVSRVVRIVVTFFMTLFGWLLFRVQDMGQLATILHNMAFNFRWVDETTFIAVPTFSMLCLLLCYHAWQERTGNMLVLLAAPPRVRQFAYAFLIILVIAVGFQPVPFVYFQF
jgi:D-alanyl-lipoteichoic acid acyltransferase DltB (MBOAT superfamily)